MNKINMTRVCVLLGILLCGTAIAQTCDVFVSETPDSDVFISSALLPVLFADSPTTGPPLREPDMEWVEDTLSSMTLDEKIGQMIITGYHTSGEYMIDNYKAGGFIFTGNNQSAANIVASVNRLQNYADLPLWFAIDSEAGLGARVADATIFPLIMAFGATRDPALTEQCGRITARESRALGIQISFGPVVDVNTEPVNPIISTRSYSDDPALVTSMAQGYITGARAEGILCTFKHYPGHGATTGDSHSSLPVVDLPMNALEAYHIKPYRDLAASGNIDFVMTAHVWYTAIHPTPWPATLSSICLKDILRTSIGYEGVIVSDSYNMQGLIVAVSDPAERAVVGVEAGLDIILNPSDMASTFSGIKNAVLSSRIPISRINESVRRILIAKSRVGLPEQTTVDPSLWPTVLQHPEHQAKVREVSEKAFTEAKYTLPTKPCVNSDSHTLVLDLAATTKIFYRFSSTYFTTPYLIEVPNSEVHSVSTSVSSSERAAIVALAQGFDRVIVLGYDWYNIASSNQVTLINALCALDVPIIYVGFGAPYHYLQIPDVDAFYCGYASVPAMQEVAVEVLVGDRTPIGELPVIVEGLNTYPNFQGFLLF